MIYECFSHIFCWWPCSVDFLSCKVTENIAYRCDSVGAADLWWTPVWKCSCPGCARAVREGGTVATASNLYDRSVHDHDQMLDAGCRESAQFQGACWWVCENGPRSWSVSCDPGWSFYASPILFVPGTQCKYVRTVVSSTVVGVARVWHMFIKSVGQLSGFHCSMAVGCAVWHINAYIIVWWWGAWGSWLMPNTVWITSLVVELMMAVQLHVNCLYVFTRQYITDFAKVMSQMHIRGWIDSLVIQLKGSLLLIPKLTTGYEPRSVSSASHHNQSTWQYPSILSFMLQSSVAFFMLQSSVAFYDSPSLRTCAVCCSLPNMNAVTFPPW